MDLFSHNSQESGVVPLAEKLRPRRFEDFVGQKNWADPNSVILKNLRANNFLPNLILWGPPGTGKTTFARLLSSQFKANFISCNAIDTGAKELRQIGVDAHHRKIQFSERTLLFVDEIHRLNKSQQDVLLPFTEKGDVTLVGATTENPSYELNSALLSRCQVLLFNPLSLDDLRNLLVRAGGASGVQLRELFQDEVLEVFLESVSGDARRLLNDFETLVNEFKGATDKTSNFPLDLTGLNRLFLGRQVRYDKKGDEHYNVISAFIKSVRGSDPDAAVYYLARMLEGGEDPVFIGRRLVILASEDVGNADPKGLPLAVAGLQAVELVGMPEARICLSQVTTYLASAPKSNRAYGAINKAIDYVKKTGALPVPMALRSSQTRIAKNLGFGEGYKYSHDYTKSYAKQDFLPEEARSQKFYEPNGLGFEKNIAQHLAWVRDRSEKKEED